MTIDDTAIEVKSTEDVDTADLKGLKAIAEEGSFKSRIIVSREPLPRVKDGVEILPWREFVDRLWRGDIV